MSSGELADLAGGQPPRLDGGAADPAPRAERRAVGWRRFVSLGDSLTAGRGDKGPEGRTVGWARRLAAILTERTAVACEFTNLAVDGAGVATVLRQQFPQVKGLAPDLVSVTVGMNDVRVAEFDPKLFAADLAVLLDGLWATGATLLTCTLPNFSDIDLPPEYRAYAEMAKDRLATASSIIRAESARTGARCLDLWGMGDLITDAALFTADRLHPNSAGHLALAAEFASLLLPG